MAGMSVMSCRVAKSSRRRPAGETQKSAAAGGVGLVEVAVRDAAGHAHEVAGAGGLPLAVELELELALLDEDELVLVRVDVDGDELAGALLVSKAKVEAQAALGK